MNYFLDTEFIEYPRSIDLISIGIVAENGKELYLVNSDCNLDRASDWVVENVLKNMPEYCPKTNDFQRPTATCYTLRTRKQIASQVLQFIGGDKPIFWGYFADYDWVVFCWLFGPMHRLPNGWPMYCRDIKQEIDRLGVTDLPAQSDEHNALSDARWCRDVYRSLFPPLFSGNVNV